MDRNHNNNHRMLHLELQHARDYIAALRTYFDMLDNLLKEALERDAKRIRKSDNNDDGVT